MSLVIKDLSKQFHGSDEHTLKNVNLEIACIKMKIYVK